MELTEPYVVLKHPDGSPAIYRIDRIQSLEKLPGGKTRITYNDREYIVCGEYTDITEEIWRLQREFVKRRQLQELKQERENNDSQGA